MDKSPEAFRTISEVADWLGTPAHVLRFWESKFAQVKPIKRAGGRRYYRPSDMALLGGLKKLLHEDGMSIKGAQTLLREQGVKHVAAMSQPLDGEDEAIEATASAVEPSEAPRDITGLPPFILRTEDDDQEDDRPDQEEEEDQGDQPMLPFFHRTRPPQREPMLRKASEALDTRAPAPAVQEAAPPPPELLRIPRLSALHTAIAASAPPDPALRAKLKVRLTRLRARLGADPSG